MPDSPRARDYLRDRVEQYRGWYDGRAQKCKRWYLRLRVVGIVAGATVPALILAPFAGADAAAVLASIVVLLTVASDGVLRLREQWENYRYTEQYLDREKQLFLAAAGPYRGLAEEPAFLRFVERVEWAIGAENSTTLTTLALAPDIRVGSSGEPGEPSGACGP